MRENSKNFILSSNYCTLKQNWLKWPLRPIEAIRGQRKKLGSKDLCDICARLKGMRKLSSQLKREREPWLQNSSPPPCFRRSFFNPSFPFHLLPNDYYMYYKGPTLKSALFICKVHMSYSAMKMETTKSCQNYQKKVSFLCQSKAFQFFTISSIFSIFIVCWNK